MKEVADEVAISFACGQINSGDTFNWLTGRVFVTVQHLEEYSNAVCQMTPQVQSMQILQTSIGNENKMQKVSVNIN